MILVLMLVSMLSFGDGPSEEGIDDTGVDVSVDAIIGVGPSEEGIEDGVNPSLLELIDSLTQESDNQLPSISEEACRFSNKRKGKLIAMCKMEKKLKFADFVSKRQKHRTEVIFCHVYILR